MVNTMGDYVRDAVSTVFGTRPDLNAVLKAANIQNYSPAETQEIRDILTQVYNGSDTGREMLRDAVEEGGPGITIDRNDSLNPGGVTNNAYAYAGTGRVHMDMAFAPTLTGIDEAGETFALSNTYVLTHELVHAITGEKDLGRAGDGDPNSANRGVGKHYRDNGDYEGDTERTTKVIMDELGIDDYRVSYDSVDGSGQLSPGTDFVDKGTVDNGVVSYNVRVDTRVGGDDLVIDVSDGLRAGARGNIRTGGGDDVVHARGGDDRIDSGPGADRVYAGDGDDTIKDGSGSDLYEGGAGMDTVDYTSRGSAPMDVVMGAQGTTVTRPRGWLSDEVDTLKSVEVLTAPPGVQTARIEGLEATSYIDMGAGRDRLTLGKELGANVSIDYTDGVVPAGQPGAGQPYGLSITDGVKTLRVAGVADGDVTDERPTPAPVAPSPAAPDASPETEAGATTRMPIGTVITNVAEAARDPRVAEATAAHSGEAMEVVKMFEGLKQGGVEDIEVPKELSSDPAQRFTELVKAGSQATAEMHKSADASSPGVEAGPERTSVGAEDEYSYGL